MSGSAYSHYLVVDLEATCADDGSLPRDQTAIIEIGAVMAEAEGFKPVSEFQTFIRPSLHPRLTPFCQALTQIRQADVDGAPAFPEALAAFRQWACQFPGHLFCSWGDYDRNQLKQDCERHGVLYPFGEHINLKAAFSSAQQLPRKQGMAGALRLAGLALAGTHHRGIDDSRNIARLLPYIFGDARLPPR